MDQSILPALNSAQAHVSTVSDLPADSTTVEVLVIVPEVVSRIAISVQVVVRGIGVEAVAAH